MTKYRIIKNTSGAHIDEYRCQARLLRIGPWMDLYYGGGKFNFNTMRNAESWLYQKYGPKSHPRKPLVVKTINSKDWS